MDILGNIWKDTEDNLFIKQSAILDTIKEHYMIQTKQLRKQFLGLSERTLRYHLRKLVDLGLVTKRGTTKGVWYEVIIKDKL